MKAIVVAENKSTIAKISSALNEVGYDVIVYRWLLKALDNLEEIAPHLVVISTVDYPRHWKILTQYIQSTFKDNPPEIVLYTSEDFSSSELNKANALNIKGHFSSDSEEGLKKLKNIVKPEKTDDEEKVQTFSEMIFEDDASVDIDSEENQTTKPFVFEDLNESNFKNEEEITTTTSKPISKSESFEVVHESSEMQNREPLLDTDEDEFEESYEQAPEISWNQPTEKTIKKKAKLSMGEEIMALFENQPTEGQPQTIPCSFVFTNPITLAMVSGLARNYDGETLEFTPDVQAFIKNLDKGTRIENATLKADEKIEPVHAEVLSNDEEKLILKIKK